MSLIKTAVKKALGTIGIKARSVEGSLSRGYGISSRDLAKLTTNTALKHSGLGSNYSKITGAEPW